MSTIANEPPHQLLASAAPSASSSATTIIATAAAAPAVENLDERMERIRKRNEELEQKHREAEADRLAALRNNAMVVTTSRPAAAATADEDDDDWPRAHRYDTYEFAYETANNKTDAASGKAELANRNGSTDESTAETTEIQQQTTVSVKGPGGRDYKKFADGEGPPPDPSFNFLADAERDGNKQRRAAAAERTNISAKGSHQLNSEPRSNKDWRSPAVAGTSDGEQTNHRQRGGVQGSSFKSPRGQNNNNSTVGKAGNAGRLRNVQQRAGDESTTGNSAQWKTERERIDESRVGRQKTGDGRWRREWDNEKTAENKVDNAQTKGTTINQMPNNNAAALEKELKVGGNGTTVSMSKDGQVKSVKLPSNRAIGSGRVGPRQQHSSASIVGNAAAMPAADHIQFSEHLIHAAQPQPHPYYQKKNNAQQLMMIQQQKQQQQPLPAYLQPTPTVFFDRPGVAVPLLPLTAADAAANVPPATRQFLESRPKLQDRLARHRQPINTVAAPDSATEIASP